MIQPMEYAHGTRRGNIWCGKVPIDFTYLIQVTLLNVLWHQYLWSNLDEYRWMGRYQPMI